MKTITKVEHGTPEYFKEISEVLYEYHRFKFDGGTLDQFKERLHGNTIVLKDPCQHQWERIESTVPYEQCSKCWRRKSE